MSQIKLKIINKAKEGILLSPAKGAEPVRISWDEFNKNYTIKEKIWAIPNEDFLKKTQEVAEHVDKAAMSFIMAGGLKSPDTPLDLGYTAVLGEETQKIMELTNCTGAEALELIRKCITMLKNATFGGGKKKFHKNKKSDAKPKKKSSTTFGPTTSAVLADNPALLALKEKFAK